jgi:hypothetical protein
VGLSLTPLRFCRLSKTKPLRLTVPGKTVSRLAVEFQQGVRVNHPISAAG